jgi:hypothetical protein
MKIFKCTSRLALTLVFNCALSTLTSKLPEKVCNPTIFKPEVILQGEKKSSKSATKLKRRSLLRTKTESSFLPPISDSLLQDKKVRSVAYTERWEHQFSQLMLFKQRIGHCNVPLVKSKRNSLSHWVNWQREMRRSSKMQGKREERLTALGFVWSSSSAWIGHFAKLARFRMDHGHSNVPRRWARDPHLGSWVSWLRQMRKRRLGLSPERLRMLDALGFEWVLWDPKMGPRLPPSSRGAGAPPPTHGKLQRSAATGREEHGDDGGWWGGSGRPLQERRAT